MKWISFVIFGAFGDLFEEGAAWRWLLHRTKAGHEEEEREETQVAFGVLVAEECFYLAAFKVRLKAVNKTQIWQKTNFICVV